MHFTVISTSDVSQFPARKGQRSAVLQHPAVLPRVSSRCNMDHVLQMIAAKKNDHNPMVDHNQLDNTYHLAIKHGYGTSPIFMIFLFEIYYITFKIHFWLPNSFIVAPRTPNPQRFAPGFATQADQSLTPHRSPNVVKSWSEVAWKPTDCVRLVYLLSCFWPNS